MDIMSKYYTLLRYCCNVKCDHCILYKNKKCCQNHDCTDKEVSEMYKILEKLRMFNNFLNSSYR